MEALAIACSSYNYMHRYLDNTSYTKPSTYSTSSPLEILHKIAVDTRFDGLFDRRGDGNIDTLFQNHEDLIMEHWNAWKIDDPTKQFQDSQETAVALLVRTVQPGTHAYDFFLVHLLTSSHAVRILIPQIPKRFHVSLVRQWWLLTIAVYIAQLRPKINDDIEVKPIKQWVYVEDKAINGPWATDAHYVKGASLSAKTECLLIPLKPSEL
jgi:Questin oxidase-like